MIFFQSTCAIVSHRPFKASYSYFWNTKGLEVVAQVLGVSAFVVQPKRWIVERTFGWFAFHRRLNKDYEVKVAHSELFIYWTMIKIMSKQIRGT